MYNAFPTAATIVPSGWMTVNVLACPGCGQEHPSVNLEHVGSSQSVFQYYCYNQGRTLTVILNMTLLP